MDGRAFGQSCLLARGWSKPGVRVVTVNMFDTVFNRVTWDCHGAAPFSTLDDYARELLPTFDQAFTALIDDLEQRGRLETTLVVAAGEFGRTPGSMPPAAATTGRASGASSWPAAAFAAARSSAPATPTRPPRRPPGHAPGPAGHDLSQPGDRREPVLSRPDGESLSAGRERRRDPRTDSS